MDCREKILSNDYYDVITEFPVQILDADRFDLCYLNVDNLYNIVYINKADIPNTDDYVYTYKGVPKLYGLMQENFEREFDPNSLIVSGITQVQRPPLSLTGQGTVICLIDTGDCVTLLPDSLKPVNRRDCADFAQRKNVGGRGLVAWRQVFSE